MNTGREASYLLLALLACRAMGPKPRGWNGRRWAIAQIAHLVPDMEAAITVLERAGVVDVLRTSEATKFRLNRQGLALGSALDLNIARLEVLRLIKGGIVMLTPYLKLYANDILLDEKVKSLSDKGLGSLIRCMAHASNNGGSIPVDPVALGKLLSIRPSSAAKLLPMLRVFFTDFREIPPSFLEDFQQFLESLFKDFGKSKGRIYSGLVLDSLGPYSKVVNNNREIAAQGTGREHSKQREKSETGRLTRRSTAFTSTNKTVVSLLVSGEEDFDPAISEVQAVQNNETPDKAMEPTPMQDGGSITPVVPEKGTPRGRIAKAWNAMVKAMGRADLKVMKGGWAEIGPLIEESLGKLSEEDHRNGIAFVGTWGAQWWHDANKMTIKSFLKKAPEYAKKFIATPSTPKTKPSAEKRPRTVAAKISPDDLAMTLARHPRGTEIWEKVQGLFPRIQLADAAAMTDVLLEGKVTPDKFLSSAEHKFASVSGPEFMPSFGRWLTEGCYLLHHKPLTVPNKAQGKLRQDITGGVGIMGRSLEAKKKQHEPKKENTND